MPYSITPQKHKRNAPSFSQLSKPLRPIVPNIAPLVARGNRDLKMTFEDQLHALIYFHLQEHSSGRHLLQELKEDEFARSFIAPEEGIEKSSFFEAINTRGLTQLKEVFEALQGEAHKVLPKEYKDLGDLTVIDGSLIDATLSMYWADYRDGAKKAKAHLGFDINHGIPRKIFLTDGKGDERPFVSLILLPGHTGILDRYYQCHKNFDQWQKEKKHFVCRIKAKTTKTLITAYDVNPDSIVFYDALVLLGTPGVNQTEIPVRVVGYKVDNINYWVATDRFDLTSDQVAMVYKLRWAIESFFAWWKRHLRVYHLIARSPYGLMVQLLSGLITYILLAIYCHEQHGEKVTIRRVRQLRIQILNETRDMGKQDQQFIPWHIKNSCRSSYAKT